MTLPRILPILSHCQLYFSLSTSHRGSMDCVAVSSRPPFPFFSLNAITHHVVPCFVTARCIKMWIKKKRGKRSSEVIATSGLARVKKKLRVGFIWIYTLLLKYHENKILLNSRPLKWCFQTIYLLHCPILQPACTA